MSDTIRLCAPGVSLRFAPIYIAEEIGAFERRNVRLDATVDGGPVGSLVARRLIDGDADVGCGGLWLHLMYEGAGIGAFTMPDALCHRHPGVLISRSPMDGFTWGALHGKCVINPLAGTGQTMLLEGVFREQGLDISSVRRVRDISGQTALELWRGGLGDFIVTDMAAGGQLIDEGSHLAVMLAEGYGSIPFTVFYALAEKDREADSKLKQFRAGVEEGLSAVLTRAPVENARMIAHRFPTLDLPQIEQTLAKLIELGVWKDTTRMSGSDFRRYQAMMIAYGGLGRELSDRGNFTAA